MSDLAILANRDYVDRVNRAIDYVTNNLASPLKLGDVARVACFSPHHFHRIFRGLMGETLATFVKRVRLERAVFLLSHRTATSLTEIALACGFASSSEFSRSFRNHYGMPPRAFDVDVFRKSRREQGLGASESPQGQHRLQQLPKGENPDAFKVRLRPLDARRVAYLRVHQPYEGDGVFVAAQRLRAWAEPRGLSGGQWLGYQWDDPDIVALDNCRYDVGLEIPDTLEVDDEVSTTRFPAMLVAELDIAGGVELELRALDWIYTTWLPRSGFAPDNQPGFEAFNGWPFEHGQEYFELRAQIPVVDAKLPL
ncbi:MAG: AraC family transcriptional regulator [Nannocystales bacterium]